jgi:hypothetical protein
MELSRRPLFDNPLDAALFVGRDEADRLEQNCRDGVNTLVLGDRGMGKTSLLRYVLFRLRESGFPAVGVDAAPAETGVDLLRLISGRLRPAELGVPRWPEAETINLGEVGEILSLVRGLGRYASQEQRTAILIDLVPGAESVHRLFGRFRDELWQLPFTWAVVAPSEMRVELLAPPADAFFEDVIELKPLTPKQQEELVCRRLDEGESTPWRLPSEGESSPRRLLDVVRETMRSGEPPDRHLLALAERDREVRALGRPASMLYAELENGGPASASDEKLLERLGWSRQRAAQVLAQLERASVVRAEFRPGPSGRPRKVFAIVPVGK